VAAPRQLTSVLRFREMARRWNADIGATRDMAEVYLENYIKEVFLDSDTAVAVISGIPSATDEQNILPPDKMRPATRVDWVTDLCEIRTRNPKLTNIYAELGSTFGLSAITSPLLCGRILGMLIQALGADHVLWGTDSIWWGSPRWQIEALRRFQMPEVLMQRLGYAPLTGDVKARIFGLNAASLFGVDPGAVLNPMPADFVSRMKAAYLEEGPRPSLTQYGWVLDR